MEEGLTYDDILLLPSYTDFKRRDVTLTTMLHPNITLKLPVVSAPMDTVTEDAMATKLAQVGGLGIIHRNLTIESQTQMVKNVKTTSVTDTASAAVDMNGSLLVGAAVGTGEDFEERVRNLAEAKTDCIVIDSGHGHTKFMIDAIKRIKDSYPDIPIMAGNIATFDGAKALIGAGVDMLRVGMGPGSICTTRIITGMGVPQVTAVMEAVRAAANSSVVVIADGGIKQIGDMAKALALGAHGVMLGSLFARYEESPGEIVEKNGKKYKQYRGMGSVAAMKKGGAERYGQSRDTEEKKLIAEGVESYVELKGTVTEFLYQISGSLKSSLYYLGSRNLQEFMIKAKFIKISNAALLESHPHSINITDTGSNYFSE